MPDQHVLVLNCGSSSLKFAIIDAGSGEQILTGLAERLAGDAPSIRYSLRGEKQQSDLPPEGAHGEAIAYLVALINDNALDNKLIAVGHRVVHGGEKFTRSVLIDDQVLAAIEQTSSLAPLHNPANLLGIRAAQKAFSQLPQVAVFDTAFHQTMPPKAYLYALPYRLYREHGVRRYGFHGTSHYYVSRRACEALQLPLTNSKLITAHLGNGSSVSAILNGESIDTSMGLTPLEGLVMGTRSGDIDPGLFSFLSNQLGYSLTQIDFLLNQQSGLLGISELSNDCRTLEEAHLAGNAQATLALDIFCYRLAKQIGSFLVPLGGLDALVFTGGIGENSSLIREKVLSQLGFAGLVCNREKNLAARFGAEGVITGNKGGAVAVVVPTNEEWVIAQDAARLCKEQH